MSVFTKSDFVYDEETYPNCFTATFVNMLNPNIIKQFEISTRKNDLQEMLDFLRKVVIHKGRLIGFNNIGFDYPILHLILETVIDAKKKGIEPKITSSLMYAKAQQIIAVMRKGGFGENIKNPHIPQIDLYKIWHFDNKAKSTSLKMLEFNMRSPNIEDLPFEVGKVLTYAEMDELLVYNLHDVMETRKFAFHTEEMIAFREQLTAKYGFDCTNFNDTKIGKQYLINKLEEENPGCCYTVTPTGQRKMNQTKRPVIHLKDILFDYLNFTRPEFIAIREWFRNKSITETKGVFIDLLESDLGDVAQYAEMHTKRKKIGSELDCIRYGFNDWDAKKKRSPTFYPTEQQVEDLKKLQPLGWIEEKELKSPKGAKAYYWCYNIAKQLNVVIDGFKYVYGTGGLHGSLECKIVKATDKRKIKDKDVASFYPNLSISNGIYPKHLGKSFCANYADIYAERQKYNKKEYPEINAMLKLALNGAYGESNNEFSPLYDPQFTMAITVNGQLSLCLLVDMLMQKCKSFTLIMANTDGITYFVDTDEEALSDEICTEWEKVCKLQLEGVDYSAMYIRDVNNYIAVSVDNKVKRKGTYEYDNLGWHQNSSCLVIPKAAEYALLGKGTIEEFIQAHKDEYDFVSRTKVPRSSRLTLVFDDGTEVLQQNICRYYPSKEGGKLVKTMPPLEGKEEAGERDLGIDVDWKVKTCNDMKDFSWDDLDYDYYINEASKLVTLLEEMTND